jgi:hypothetical protein
MAIIHTRKFAPKSHRDLTKPTCIKLLSNWLCVASLLTSTTAQINLNKILTDDKLPPKILLNNLATSEQSKALQAILLANIFRNSNIEAAILHGIFNQASKTHSKRSTANMDSIQKGTEILYQQLEQALAKIKNNVQKNGEMAEQIARSPRATKTIKDLEAAIATFAPSKPIAEYQLSDYATGNNCWKRAPFQYPVSIQDLLLQDIQARQRTNKILGEKIEKIVSDNELLAQQASSI